MRYLVEQDFQPAMYMLDYQFFTVGDFVTFWNTYKSRVRDCPEIEKVKEKNWYVNLF